MRIVASGPHCTTLGTELGFLVGVHLTLTVGGLMVFTHVALAVHTQAL